MSQTTWKFLHNGCCAVDFFVPRLSRGELLLVKRQSWIRHFGVCMEGLPLA